MNITSLEYDVLRNIAENLYNTQNGRPPENADDTACWVDCIISDGPCDIKTTSLPGAMASLVTKKLVWTNGTECQLTKAGHEEYLLRWQAQQSTD